MSWTKKTTGVFGDAVWSEATVQAGSAISVYSSAFSIPLGKNNNRYVSMLATCNAVTGTNIDLALYGAMTEGGTKFLLLDAPVADLTKAGSAYAMGGRVDLAAYPAPFYYIGMLADVDESANTVTLSIYIPAVT
jgi:hypothetical protein